MREGAPGTECRSGVGADGGWLCCCSLIALQMSIRKGVGRRGGIQRLKVRSSKMKKKFVGKSASACFILCFGWRFRVFLKEGERIEKGSWVGSRRGLGGEEGVSASNKLDWPSNPCCTTAHAIKDVGRGREPLKGLLLLLLHRRTGVDP